MSDADIALARAKQAIADAAKSGRKELKFTFSVFRALVEIPAEIASLTGLQSLDLSDTQITNLAPLAGITGLQTLWLNSTQITDLAPLARMPGLQDLYLSGAQITDLAPLAGMTGLQDLYLSGTQITDLAPLAGMTGLHSLRLDSAPVTDLAPLAGLIGLQVIDLDRTHITDLAPLAGLTRLQILFLDSTQITDLAPLAGLVELTDLTLNGSQVAELRPIMGLDKLGTNGRPGLAFENTTATARDARLAELAQIKDTKRRARETLDYLRSLPPYPQPYLPAATPDGSPPQWIGDDVDAQAQAVSEALPLDEEIVQDPETGTFDVRARPVAKPDLYGVTLKQVDNALQDVLANPKNGLRADESVVRRIRRALDRYANDPQYVEMELTAANASLLRQLASGDLPPSDENQHLQMVVQQTTVGIRAAHPAIDLNRRMLQEQALREMPREARKAVAELGPLYEAITTGELQAQMREDVAELSNPTEMPPPPPPPPPEPTPEPPPPPQKSPNFPRLGGASRDTSLRPPSPETVRVIGRTTRIIIALRKGAKRLAIGGAVTYGTVEVLETLTSFFMRVYEWLAPFL